MLNFVKGVQEGEFVSYTASSREWSLPTDCCEPPILGDAYRLP